MKRKRLTADERRGQIAEAATKLFALNGFQGVTTRQIAKAAKVNEALLYKYFPNKKALYAEIIGRKLAYDGAIINPSLLEGEDDRAILKRIIEGFITAVSRDKSFMRLMLFSGLEDKSLSTEFLEQRVGQVVPCIMDYFNRRIESGAFRRCDPRVAIRALVGMVMHYLVSKEIFRIPEFLDVSEEAAVDGFADIFLEGVRVR